MRCVACDKPLSVSESPWLPEQGRFEDMCRGCRSTIMDVEVLPTNKELVDAASEKEVVAVADLPWE